jgi:hypothetical protein
MHLLFEWKSFEEFVNDVSQDCGGKDTKGQDQKHKGARTDDDGLIQIHGVSWFP